MPDLEEIIEVEDVEEEGPLEEHLPAGEGRSVGSTLRLARERLGYEVEHVARVLCVRQQFLKNVEEGKFADVPYGDAYILPFIRAYGEYLDLGDLDDLCRRGRTELLPLYPSLKILEQEDVLKVGDLPGDKKVSVWQEERFARRAARYTSRVWVGASLVVIVLLGFLSWRFYQVQTNAQQEKELMSLVSEDGDEPSASALTPFVQIRSTGATVEVYVFGPKGVVYDGILEPGKPITLPREPGLRFSVSPSSGWELVVNEEVVPMDIALSSSGLDEIAELVKGN